MTESQVHEKLQLSDHYDYGCGAEYARHDFIDCTFTNCWLSMTDKPSSKNIFRDINLVNSTQVNSGIDVAIVENVCVDGLRCIRDPFFAHGAVYRHVVLKGKLDRLVLKSLPVEAVEDPMIKEIFSESADSYYSGVDWALDISEAECHSLNIHGIPADLIRRDPATQAVVRAKNISTDSLGSLSWLGADFVMSLELFLKRGDEDVVLIAPKRKKDFQRLLGEIERLREAGIADRD